MCQCDLELFCPNWVTWPGTLAEYIHLPILKFVELLKYKVINCRFRGPVARQPPLPWQPLCSPLVELIVVVLLPKYELHVTTEYLVIAIFNGINVQTTVYRLANGRITHQKQQVSAKRWYYAALHCQSVNLLLSNVTFFWYCCFWCVMRRHLEFWLDGIFGHVIQFQVLFVSTHKIWAKSLNAGQSYGYISKIQNGGRPPFWNCNGVI